MRILSFFFIFLLIQLSGALRNGSCHGLVCGLNGDCHNGPIEVNQTTYWCRCHNGFGGELCERRCELQCSNGEKCVFQTDGQPKCVCEGCDNNGVRIQRRTINCPTGYGGTRCELSGWCHYSNACENGGFCSGNGSSAKCICPKGFKGAQCEIDVNECEENTHSCGVKSTCINTHGTYLCVCPHGYLPPDCQPPKNQIELKNRTVCFVGHNGDGMNCQNGGVCDMSTCHCPPGYTGSTCEIEQSKQSEGCGGLECINGDCFPIKGGFQCICHDGYSGSSCEIGRNNCIDHKCAPGSVCINGLNSYFCDCPPRRTGQYCEKIECNAIPGLCNHGRCINNPHSDKPFDCECDPGYEGELCDVDKNECLADHVCLNNGTCVNLRGSFRCDCPRGYSGKWCDETLDMCENVKCENGGTCMHTTDRSPVCQCKNGFIGKRCEKECPPGFGGVRCDIPLESRVCSRRGAKCFNGGKCIGGFCTCPPDFTGNHCELSRREVFRISSDNTCASDPCMNNATCIDVDAHIGYVCLCQSGFEGDICERLKDVCFENPCANGGKCQQMKDSFVCTCPDGFKGDKCEQKLICHEGQCKNGGICQLDGNVSKCQCSYGFTGPNCEQKINLEEFFDKEKLLRSVCEKKRCWERANDGNCDEDCNFAACNFDGGDCSGRRQPFSRCTYGNLCADLFSNGVCDQACNNENCLYDGMDCMSAVVRCPTKIREYCAARFANGVCDPECNTDGCGFDGGDCSNETSTTILTDIRIKIQMSPTEFQMNGGQTLMEISSALRAAVRIQQDENGPLVFEWDGEKEMERVPMDVQKLSEQHVLSSSVKRRIRSAQNIGGPGVVVYLEVQEDCLPGKCLYTDAQSVVDIISARLAKRGTNSFGAPISEAIVAPRQPKKMGSGWYTVLFCFALFLMMVVMVAGVAMKSEAGNENRNRKRKMINAPVWVPPMENEEKNRRNHHHQSVHSSQNSLLEVNGNGYYDMKRHRGGYDPTGGQYQPFYSYGNGFQYEGQMQHIQGQEENQVDPYHPENIPLHIQAAGTEAIQATIDRDSVNLRDSKYNRNVLHWLAGNTNLKNEELVAREVKMCIEAGAEVNVMDCDENTPLMLAVKSMRHRVAVLLMRAGADPTIYNQSEKSCLHEAAVNKDLRIMETLLTDKRLVRDIEELDRNGLTVLMEVARNEGCYQVEMAKLLLSKGAKIDCDGSSRKDSEIFKGRTALHYAALVDNRPMVEFLVSQNANKDKQDEAGQTPIMLAAKEGHEHTVRLLIRSGASVEAVDALDHSARQLAVFKHHHRIVDIFDEYNPEFQMGVHQSSLPSTSRKSVQPRPTFKNTKKQNVKKKESGSRDSTHLTPPPSDGSTSSPSPQHFVTNTTPTSNHYMSPEYQTDAGSSDGFQPQFSAHANGDMWFTASPTYPPMQNQPMMRPEAYQYY